jgi:probable F420-dependent oxidoreductase
MALSVKVGVGWEPFGGGGRVSAEDFWRAVEAMEEIGYDSIWLSDSATRAGLAPLPALAAVAARTDRLKLGIGVLVIPPRNPALLAKELATVDALSEGRLLPAAGLGIDLPSELAAMAVPKGQRAARLEEAIEIVRLLWTGEPVTYDGRFWSLTDATLSPTPASAKLEMWLGGSAPRALERVGRIGDGWLGSFVSPQEFGGMADTIRAAASAAGRTIDDDHYGTTLFAAPSEDEIPPELWALLSRRDGLALGDHVALSAPELRALLERFHEQGASKFVVVPVARDVQLWMRELYEEAVGPVEAATRAQTMKERA